MNSTKNTYQLGAVIALWCMSAQAVFAESGNQVYYRFGGSFSKNSRGSQVFTDTNGAAGVNDGKSGMALGAGLDLMMYGSVGPGDLLGEVNVEYAQFSKKLVRQTTSALLAGTNNSEVTVSELAVAVAPKYRFNLAEGSFRPWIIPAGLVYLVNSPPSNDTTYLDVGYHVGAGLEYRIINELSIGADLRYTFAFNQPQTNSTYGSYALYTGLNF